MSPKLKKFSLGAGVAGLGALAGYAIAQHLSPTDPNLSMDGMNKRYEGPIASIEIKSFNVEDADTINAVLSGGQNIQLRLAGIDAPEIEHESNYSDSKVGGVQPYGKEATKYLEDLLESQDRIVALLDPTQQGTYGRAAAVLFGDDGQNINLSLVEAGAAASLPYGSVSSRLFDSSAFRSAQEDAYENQRGMWGDEGWRAVYSIQQNTKQKLTHNTFTELGRLFDNFKASTALHRLQNPDAEFSNMMATGGRHDFNTIEGMRHTGIAGATRKQNTDFGSGWRGLIRLPAEISSLPQIKMVGGFVATAPSIEDADNYRAAAHKNPKLKAIFEKLSDDQVLKLMPDLTSRSGWERFLTKSGVQRTPRIEDFLGQIDSSINRGMSPIFINVENIEMIRDMTGLSTKEIAKGFIKHERVHQNVRKTLPPGELLSGEVPEGWKRVMERSSFYAKKPHHWYEEYVAHRAEFDVSPASIDIGNAELGMGEFFRSEGESKITLRRQKRRIKTRASASTNARPTRPIPTGSGASNALVLGGLGLAALGLLWAFSGDSESNKEGNTIEGLTHNWAQNDRKDNIGDFGSGYVIDKVVPTMKKSTKHKRTLQEGHRYARGYTKAMMRRENLIKHNRGN